MQSGSGEGAHAMRSAAAIGARVMLVLGMAGWAHAQPVSPGEAPSFQTIAGVGFAQSPGPVASAPVAQASQAAVATSPVPEPGTGLMLLLSGVAGLWAWRRSRLWRER